MANPSSQSFKAKGLHLTSTVIPFKPDGDYEYHDQFLLVPHEAIRRDMLRAKNALINFNVVVNPWKANFFHYWWHKFFSSFVRHHHHVEEEYVMKYYVQTKGEKIPERFSEDHGTLLARIDTVDRVSSELAALVAQHGTPSEADPIHEQITAKSLELVKEYNDFNDHMLLHLAEEEEYFPEIFKKHGTKVAKEIENRIVSHIVNHCGESGKLVNAAVLTSMGITYQIAMTYHEDDLPYWAGEDVRTTFLSQVPYPVKRYLFPRYIVRYNRMKGIINAIAHDEDVTLKFNVVADNHANCGCIIA
eukprot:gene13161-17630_t